VWELVKDEATLARDLAFDRLAVEKLTNAMERRGAIPGASEQQPILRTPGPTAETDGDLSNSSQDRLPSPGPLVIVPADQTELQDAITYASEVACRTEHCRALHHVATLVHDLRCAVSTSDLEMAATALNGCGSTLPGIVGRMPAVRRELGLLMQHVNDQLVWRDLSSVLGKCAVCCLARMVVVVMYRRRTTCMWTVSGKPW
jgi:hypothetical protein